MRREPIGARVAGAAVALAVILSGLLAQAQVEAEGGGSTTLTSTQVAYGSATNTVTSEAAFTYNASTDTLTASTLQTGTIRSTGGEQQLFFSSISGSEWTNQAAGTVSPIFGIRNTNALTTGTLFRVRAGSTDYLTVTAAGVATPLGLLINTSTARPTCAAAIRGTIWVTQGGAGVADVWEKCGKDAADAYAWSAL